MQVWDRTSLSETSSLLQDGHSLEFHLMVTQTMEGHPDHICIWKDAASRKQRAGNAKLRDLCLEGCTLKDEEEFKLLQGS